MSSTSIVCRSGGVMHSHDSVAAVRVCQQEADPGAVAPSYQRANNLPTRREHYKHQSVHPDNVNALPTPAQITYAGALGADVRVLPIMTRAQVSSYIGILKGGSVPDDSPTVTTAPALVVPAYVPPPKPPVYEFPEHIATMVRNLPKGYYAWQPDTITPLTFIRVRDQKTGARRGQRIIATQHGPNFKDQVIIYPNGKVLVLSRNTQLLENVLIGIVLDKFTAAKTYALEKGRCWNCHLELTDERSRWYGIGPICEPRVPWYVEQFDNDKGFTFEERPIP